MTFANKADTPYVVWTKPLLMKWCFEMALLFGTITISIDKGEGIFSWKILNIFLKMFH